MSGQILFLVRGFLLIPCCTVYHQSLFISCLFSGGKWTHLFHTEHICIVWNEKFYIIIWYFQQAYSAQLHQTQAWRVFYKGQHVTSNPSYLLFCINIYWVEDRFSTMLSFRAFSCGGLFFSIYWKKKKMQLMCSSAVQLINCNSHILLLFDVNIH